MFTHTVYKSQSKRFKTQLDWIELVHLKRQFTRQLNAFKFAYSLFIETFKKTNVYFFYQASDESCFSISIFRKKSHLLSKRYDLISLSEYICLVWLKKRCLLALSYAFELKVTEAQKGHQQKIEWCSYFSSLVSEKKNGLEYLSTTPLKAVVSVVLFFKKYICASLNQWILCV